MRSVVRSGTSGRDPICVLDPGSSKIACLIAGLQPGRAGESPSLRVGGIGHQRSRGLKAGVIMNLDEAEAAIRSAVGQAERMAGISVDSVYVGVSCGRLRSSTFAASAEVEGGFVKDDDIGRLLAGGKAYAERDGRVLVHMSQIGFRLDGAAGVRDPRGMAARALVGDLHAVTADDAPVRNLLLAIERCHLGISGFAATPYASALAVLTPEERRLGATVIDIGGGTATIAMFAEDHFIHVDALPVGGHHITFDIARELSAPVAEAERIKALYGTMVRARSDEHEVISYPAASEDEGVRHTTKARLHEIVRPRVESMVQLVLERVRQAPLASAAVGRLVLTGGCSQLVGFGEFVANVSGYPVRVARPLSIGGLPPNVCNPAFSAAAGLLQVAASGDVATGMLGGRGIEPSGYLRRVGSWLKEF